MVQVQGGQGRVDLQRLRDRLGTLVPDLVVVEGQGGHHLVDLQRLRDRDGSLIPDVVTSEGEGGQDRVDLQRLRDRNGSLSVVYDLTSQEFSLPVRDLVETTPSSLPLSPRPLAGDG